MNSDEFFDVDSVYEVARHTSGAGVPQPTPPVLSAACALWRRNSSGARELFVARRNASMRFLGGYWSFPGGVVDKLDRAEERSEAETLLAACVRELKEELGVDLPRDLTAYLSGGRWKTPPNLPWCFDATYLVHHYRGTREPDVSHSGDELTEGGWYSPAHVIAQWKAGLWLLPSVVLRVVRVIGEVDPGEEPESFARAIESAGEAEARAPDLWFPLDGIGVSPLRTPTLPPATHTNCLVVVGERAVVIDPGAKAKEEQSRIGRALEALPAPVDAVLLTHHHMDHVSGALDLSERLGVPIHAHSESQRLLAERLPVSRALKHDELIDLGGRALRCMHTPGHAPGHLCFIEEKTGVAYVGDMVAQVGTILIDPSEGDMGEYIESLRRLRSMDLAILIPSHGGPIVDPAGHLDKYITHRLWREEKICAALSERATASAELVKIAYDDVPPIVHPLAERSMLSHLHKLQTEGRALRSARGWLRA